MKRRDTFIERTIQEIEREPTKVEMFLTLILWIVFVPFIIEVFT